MVTKINVVKGAQASRLGNMRYLVRIPDLIKGINIGFSSVSGLSFGDIEEIEYREGTDAMTPVKYPGQTSFENITFERGVAFDLAAEFMERWHGAVSQAGEGLVDNPQDGLERIAYLKNPEIYVRNKDGVTGRALGLKDAWLKNISLADLSGDGNEIWIATFEIVHHGLIRLADDWFTGINPANLLPTT